jgi:hypothetical protein
MTAAALKAMPLVFALAGGIGGDVLAGASAPGAATHPRWVEVKWPFPIDEWGAGRAFSCGVDACGMAVSVYLRPKIGFCDCARGVHDDAELDRVGDIVLMGPEFSGIGDGQPVTVGWMTGRSRVFLVAGAYQPTGSAAAIAFNDKCDVVVATVTADADLARGERKALAFLNTDIVLRWVGAELGSDGS